MATTVVVTGASAGVGRAIARAFADAGCNVGLLARDAERLAQAAGEVEARGQKAHAVPTDVADPEAVERAAEEIEQNLGPIDVWVNDAMVTIFAPVHEIAPEEFRRSTEVTYLGAVYGTMAALRRMRQRRSGSIVQVGSALAFRAIPLQSPYCGGKFALRGFTDSLRCELIHEKMPIHVSMVHLPGMNTPQFDWALNKMPRKAMPVKPVYQPELAARAVVFAAFHKRREIWLGGSTWQVIIGNRLAPWLLDYILASKAWDGQMRPTPNPPDAPANLFDTVPGRQGAHGSFDADARDSAITLWAQEHPLTIAGAVVAALSGLAFGLSGRKRLV
jgi:NAD(P)-dependent dehydrogenase (short-subunit alcohol dehydrogenase family)